MLLIACAMVLVAAALDDVAVRLAPDQPAAFTYADEPLVVEFAAPETLTLHAAITFTSPASPAVRTVDLGPVTIHKAGRVWQTVANAPQARGWFEVEVALKVEEGERRIKTAFCRIDRPAGSAWQRLRYAGDPAAPAAVSAGIAANLGAAELELPAAAYPFVEARRYEVAPALRIASASTAIIESATSAPRWWIVPAASFAEAAQLSLRQTPSARVAAVGDAAAATALFDTAPETAPASWLASNVVEALAVTRAGERAGFEGLGLQILLAPQQGAEAADPNTPDGDPARTFLTPFLDAWELRANRLVVSHEALFNDAIQPALGRVAALARVLHDARYLGPVPAGAATLRGAVFLLEVSEAEVADWVVVAEPTSGETCEFEWPAEWAEKVALRDGYNNPTPSSAGDADSRIVSVAPEGIFVFGVGGRLPLLAAHAGAANAAQKLLADGVLSEVLPAPTLDAVKMIAAAAPDDSTREAFLVLIRSLPEIERAGRGGAMPPDVAVPAGAAIARLARLQAAWAQEQAEEFLEPLSETLARAAEFQSRYLTSGDPAGATPRADWLAGEVTRLIAVAREMADNDRPIEADAVAALAEWRARSLTAGAP